MMTFQLDECLSAKKLISACHAQGQVTVRAMPRRMKGSADPQILDTVMAGSNPLLTVDAAIAEDHVAHIPDFHPGIVMVVNAPSVPQTMTVSIARRILAAFKQSFSDWHMISLRNSVVQVSQEGVEVSQVIGGALQRSAYLPFSASDWKSQLQALLGANAGRPS
jgi:hypothetical protein